MQRIPQPPLQELLGNGALAVLPNDDHAAVLVALAGGHPHLAARRCRYVLHLRAALAEDGSCQAVRHHNVHLHHIGLRARGADLAEPQRCAKAGNAGSSWARSYPGPVACLGLGLGLGFSLGVGIGLGLSRLLGLLVQCSLRRRIHRGHGQWCGRVCGTEEGLRVPRRYRRYERRTHCNRCRVLQRRHLLRCSTLPLRGPLMVITLQFLLQPLVAAHLLQGQALRGLQLKQALHHGPRCFACLEPLDDRVELGLLRHGTLKGEVAGQEHKEQHTEAPEVGAEVIGLSAHDLRRDVGVRADGGERLAEAHAHGLRKAKVRDLHAVEHQGALPLL
mmetsp:Transcript_116148/g.375290  ORF Transcript_116148/g.375290 Transcript_116148/m.375290 type:complete len:333 (+) Transcript_116148:921-1919(+)